MTKKITAGMFLAIVLLFSIKTSISVSRNSGDYFKETSGLLKIKDFRKNLEAAYKDCFWKKKSVTDFYGMTERIMGRRMSNDRTYYRDGSGVMHISRESYDFSKMFSDSMFLSGYCKERNIPYMVAQLPEKGQYGDKYSKMFDEESTAGYIEELKNQTVAAGDLYMDSFEVFQRSGLSEKDVFLHTDFHCSTLAELAEMKETALLLRSRGVNLHDSEVVLDFENPDRYEKITRHMLGNLSMQYGKYFAGVDEFVYYIPKFETDMSRVRKDGTVHRTGPFIKSMTNGMLEDHDDFRYFQADFLDYPEPCYDIVNNKASDGPRLLVFTSSQSWRCITYLSLMCGKITVLDPRFFGDDNWFDKVKDRDYDAVIFFATCDFPDGLVYQD